MVDGELHRLTVHEAARRIKAGDLKSADLVEAVLKRVTETEPTVSAYTVVLADQAHEAAKAADSEMASGRWKGPLHGIPIAVKDLYMVRGVPTEAGSRTMSGYVPETDSEPIARLRSAGAIVVGKTVTTEFGYGQAIPSSRSPWDLDRYPGGSSIGSAVAVAVGSATAALGTDAGGSIRSPAAWNGIVGFKPTYGLVPKDGVISPGPTLDHCGPLTRCVEDAGIIVSAMAGATKRNLSPAFGQEANPSPGYLEGKKLGVDRAFFFSDRVQPGVIETVEKALRALEGLGATLVEVEVGDPEQVMGVMMILLAVDVSFAHQKWLRERPDQYAPGTRLVLELGELFTAMDYLRAVQFRHDLKKRMKDVFDRNSLDGLVMSTSPMTAIPFEQLKVPLGKGSGMLADRIMHVAPFNLTGQPAVSVPCGFTGDGLPVGLQFVGRPYADQAVLSMAATYEAAHEWHKTYPPV